MQHNGHFHSAHLVLGIVSNLDAMTYDLKHSGSRDSLASASSMLDDIFTSLQVQLGFRTWNKKTRGLKKNKNKT